MSTSAAAAAASLRCRGVAALTRLYPFKSGCGRIANSRLLELAAAPPEVDAWARVKGGCALVPIQDYVGRAMYFVGDLDPKVSWVIDRCVSPGDVVLDIGANLGLITLRLAARVGATGHVHAFEPNPRMVGYLNATRERNAALPISIHPIGLGAENRSLQLCIPGDNAGAATFRSSGPDRISRTIEVGVRRLSDYAREIGLDRIDFVKIDVEGFERDVIEGARELFQRTMPKVIVLEEHDQVEGRALPPSLAALHSLGYDIFGLDKRLLSVGLLPVAAANGTAACHDYVAVARQGADRLRVRLGIA